MNGELHLIVLWANARYKEEEILNDIQKYVKIRDAYDILWTKEKVANNFSRFYGQKLPDKSFKEKECGTSSFLCLVVEDMYPKYDFVETSRGHEWVNTTLFNLKEKYRSWTKGGHKIHTTNSVQETNHDSTLLLGLDYEDLKKNLRRKWDRQIKKLRRDITGCFGWKDLKEFFYTLNATIDYVVLRNSEILPDKFKSDLHGDIDILTNDYTAITFIANATPVFKEPYRVHNKVIINKEDVFFDFRFVGDNYYCYNFERDLLNFKYKNKQNIYVPNNQYAFYSLIYHALIQKKEIASDYYSKIFNLYHKIFPQNTSVIQNYLSPFDLYFQLLNQFMKKNNYEYTIPIDKTVYFSESLVNINTIIDFLTEKYHFKDIHPIYTDITSRAYNVFLSATDINGEQLFIKSSDLQNLYKNEFHKTQELYSIDPIHFVEPLYYRDNTNHNFIASKFIKSQSLKELMQNHHLTNAKKIGFIKDIYEIFQALKKSDVVHRDIRPENLMQYNNHLVLIDFQLAVSKNNYQELAFLKQNILTLAGLGCEYAYGRYKWDDSFSLLKVLEFIGCEKTYQDYYQKVYHEISDNIGKESIFYYNLRNIKHLKLKKLIYRFKGKLSFSHKKRQKYRQKRREIETILDLIKST